MEKCQKSLGAKGQNQYEPKAEQIYGQLALT
jgi:hypothetical protein